MGTPQQPPSHPSPPPESPPPESPPPESPPPESPPPESPPPPPAPRHTAPPKRAARPPPLQRWRNAADELITEVTVAAERIAAARTALGEPVFRTDGPWRVVKTVARSHYRLSISDLARALGVRKQVAHTLVHRAVRAGFIDLEPNHQDRRILQAWLTPRGRAELAAQHVVEAAWLALLLNGLGDHEMATTTHVIRIIRQRLERDARERAQR